MKKYLLFTFYFLLFTFCSKAQLIFYQDAYKGGVASDGVAYFRQDYLLADSINFQLNIPPTATIRKTYLLSLRFVYVQTGLLPLKDNTLPVYFNNTLLNFDSTSILTAYYDTYTPPADHTWICGMD